MIDPPRRVLELSARRDPAEIVGREWLVTNGLGGYASGTVAGVITRRYHGLLVAALPNPLGRMVTLDHLDERVRCGEARGELSGGDPRAAPRCAGSLDEFSLEVGLPVWRYRVGHARVEKRVIMPHRQNTVIVSYRNTGDAELELELEPWVHFRNYEASVTAHLNERYALTAASDHFAISAGDDLPTLRLATRGADAHFTLGARRSGEILYPVEEHRGYEHRGVLWIPGHFTIRLRAGDHVHLVASTERYDAMTAVDPAEAVALEHERRSRLLAAAPPVARSGITAELVLAADQFMITPAGRLADRMRLLAMGDEIRTVIAGYHWFTDWGRDTMISLEGLALCTGRYREAGSILRTFAHYVRDGLIPNLFPDGSDQGLYHTADATLWLFHALDRYVQRTGDRTTLARIMPPLHDIVDAHVRGTRFGIGMDPADALLRQGAEGYQLTWMDAKVGDWVVTPRRGKAVEINALWYNALSVFGRWIREEEGDHAARGVTELAARVRASFNARFWCERAGHLYDVVDGPDGDVAECRPNQLFAISLPNPVLERGRWQPVVDVVRERLLTPYGLRSLAPGSPSYSPRYDGDIRARDAAYHQGTVWAWLIGAWIDAALKMDGDRDAARACLRGLVEHLDDYGVGQIAEIFDAEEPYTPRGCIAQAWSVAEVLRCWIATEPDHEARQPAVEGRKEARAEAAAGSA